MNSIGLKDLGTENECWSVTVRICRMWESINTKKNRELISMDMVLVDEEVYYVTTQFYIFLVLYLYLFSLALDFLYVYRIR